MEEDYYEENTIMRKELQSYDMDDKTKLDEMLILCFTAAKTALEKTKGESKEIGKSLHVRTK